jgi:3-hydroxyisobutyrate dehydrogenase
MKRLTADQVKVGFIGLGNMGSRIAQRLLDHGYQLSVYDRNLRKAEAIAAQGGVVPKNMLELARTSDGLLSCLTDDEAVRSVYMGPEGLFAGARSGTVVLEMNNGDSCEITEIPAEVFRNNSSQRPTIAKF